LTATLQSLSSYLVACTSILPINLVYPLPDLLRSPTTALAMLERFVDLSPGDVVVQNGATSAVGQVIAVCDCAGQVITVTVQAK